MLVVRTKQYEYVTGHDDSTGLGAYCVWDAQSNLECLVEQVSNESLEQITALMMGMHPNIETRDQAITQLAANWNILSMNPILKQLILS